MTAVTRLGAAVGPVVICAWYPPDGEAGSWGDPNGAEAVSVLAEGSTYGVMCRYESTGLAVPGYPTAVVHSKGERAIAGDAVNGWEVAAHAASLLGLERPAAKTAPKERQLVGTEAWLWVENRLSYATKSAQAGSTWATVHACFSHVTWDFGALGRVRCTADATRRWNAKRSGSEQSSACTHVFTSVPPVGDGRLNATVTITWDVYWASSEHTGWRHHSARSLSSNMPLNIFQLQSAVL